MISFETVARLHALEQGRAQPLAGRRRMAIRPEARIVCALEMAGEVAAPQIVAWGGIGEQARVVCIAEPRSRTALGVLFHRAFGWVPHWMADCLDSTEMAWLQLIVPGKPTARIIALLADRLMYTQGDRRLRRIGRLLNYFAEREREAGQLSLLKATDLLTEHWATGQAPSEDEHLGALLAWHEPRTGLTAWDAVMAAEREPMGVNTDPEFDRMVLAPLVTAYHDVRLSGGDRLALRSAGRPIREALVPVVLQQYEATQRAVQLLLAAELPPLPDLGALADLEREEFGYYMEQRERGRRIARRDAAKAAAMRLTARIERSAQYEAAVRLGDPVVHDEAVRSGRIVRGVVRTVQRVQLAPRRYTYRIEVETVQLAPRPRERDLLLDLAAAKRKMTVVALRRTGAMTSLELEMRQGHHIPGPPPVGSVMELASGVPDWQVIGRRRGHVSRVLPTLPPTHESATLPRQRVRQAPPDPLAAVEALA